MEQITYLKYNKSWLKDKTIPKVFCRLQIVKFPNKLG
jgi:hypothetical protein